MTRKHWLSLTPSLVLATAIIVSTFIAVRSAHAGWLILAAPILLALSLLAADALHSRLHGAPAFPSRGALILGAAFILAALILTPKDPALIASFIPIMGVASCPILLPNNSRKICATV